MARVAAGQPLVGLDTGPSTLVQEAGLEGDAVSFDEGLLPGAGDRGATPVPGQGQPRPAGAADAGSRPPPGGAVRSGGREVGRLTSVATTPDLGVIGLAVLRREVEPGAEVEVEGAGGPARVVELPFARVSDPVASALLGPAGAAALGEAVRTLADAGMDPEPATLRVAGWTDERLGLPLPAARGRPPGGGARAPRRQPAGHPRARARPGSARAGGRPATLTGRGRSVRGAWHTTNMRSVTRVGGFR